MKKFLLTIFSWLMCAVGSAGAAQLSDKQVAEVYTGIYDTLKHEYKNKTYQKRYTTFRGFTKQVFSATVTAFAEAMEKRLKTAAWLQGGSLHYFFVRKLVVPSGSVVALRGDLHGDALSLILWLERLRTQGWFAKDNPFRLVKKDHYLAFLGDYADRGHYGAEVMFIIMQLFLHNPDQVVLVRGNHEDAAIVHKYGFVDELRNKFGARAERDILEIYKYMPVALFLGCDSRAADGVDFIQCCHGGMEPGYTAQDLLEDNRTDLYQWINENIGERMKIARAFENDMDRACSCSDAVGHLSGFQWNDFDFKNAAPWSSRVTRNQRGSYDFYKDITTSLLKAATKKGSKHHVWSVLRAHQHSGSTVPHILTYGKGIYKLWSETTKKAEQWSGEQNPQWSGKEGEPVALQKYSVWTFNVAPRAGYEVYAPDDFHYDTGAELTLEKGFDNWKFVPHKVPVMKAK